MLSMFKCWLPNLYSARWLSQLGSKHLSDSCLSNRADFFVHEPQYIRKKYRKYDNERLCHYMPVCRVVGPHESPNCEAKANSPCSALAILLYSFTQTSKVTRPLRLVRGLSCPNAAEPQRGDNERAECDGFEKATCIYTCNTPPPFFLVSKYLDRKHT